MQLISFKLLYTHLTCHGVSESIRVQKTLKSIP